MHQISLSYSSEEDRLLLIISTQEREEYRIWLSRRYTGMLLGVIRKIIDNFAGSSNHTVGEDVQNIFRDGAFDQPMDQTPDSLAFGEDGILAYGLKTEQIDDSEYGVELFYKEQKKISFGFDRANMVMFHNLLQQSLLKTVWNMPDLLPGNENIH